MYQRLETNAALDFLATNAEKFGGGIIIGFLVSIRLKKSTQGNILFLAQRLESNFFFWVDMNP